MSVLGGEKRFSPAEQAQAAQYESALRSDPRFLDWQARQKDQRGVRTLHLSDLGIQAPDGWVVNQAGHIYKNENGWLLPVVAAAVGTAGVAGLFAGGAAPAVGGTGSAAAAGIDAGGVAPAVGTGVGAGVIDGIDLGAAGVDALPVAHSGVPNFLKDPKSLASIAALIPTIRTLTGGNGSNGNSPFGGNTSGLMDQINEGLATGNQRVKQAQPVYDALVNQAYGRTPSRYRGAAPAGYAGDAAPAGAYQFTPPQFGGR